MAARQLKRRRLWSAPDAGTQIIHSAELTSLSRNFRNQLAIPSPKPVITRDPPTLGDAATLKTKLEILIAGSHWEMIAGHHSSDREGSHEN